MKNKTSKNQVKRVHSIKTEPSIFPVVRNEKNYRMIANVVKDFEFSISIHTAKNNDAGVKKTVDEIAVALIPVIRSISEGLKSPAFEIDAEDISSAIMLAILSSLRKGHDAYSSNLATHIIAIADFAVKDYVRQNASLLTVSHKYYDTHKNTKEMDRYHLLSLNDEECQSLYEEVADNSAAIEELFLEEEKAKIVKNTILAMKNCKHKEVMIEHLFFNKTSKEIAENNGMKINTVDKCINRGYKVLKDSLFNQGYI